MAKFVKMLIFVFVPFILFTACGGEDTQFDPEVWHLAEVDMFSDMEPDIPDPEIVDFGNEHIYRDKDWIVGYPQERKIIMNGSTNCSIPSLAFKAKDDFKEKFMSGVGKIYFPSLDSQQKTYSVEKMGDQFLVTFDTPIDAVGSLNYVLETNVYGLGSHNIDFFLGGYYKVLPSFLGNCTAGEIPDVYFPANLVDLFVSGYYPDGGGGYSMPLKDGDNVLATFNLTATATENTGFETGEPLDVLVEEMCFDVQNSENIYYRDLFLRTGGIELNPGFMVQTNVVGEFCFYPDFLMIRNGETIEMELGTGLEVLPFDEDFLKVEFKGMKYHSTDGNGNRSNPNSYLFTLCEGDC